MSIQSKRQMQILNALFKHGNPLKYACCEPDKYNALINIHKMIFSKINAHFRKSLAFVL